MIVLQDRVIMAVEQMLRDSYTYMHLMYYGLQEIIK